MASSANGYGISPVDRRRSVVALKNGLVALGRNAAWARRVVRSVARYPALGSWQGRRGFKDCLRVVGREALFELILDDVRARRVLYLEFGVYTGGLTRFWSERLEHPDAVLVGFDSFEGLPEAWKYGYPRGYFSTQGRVPVIPDRRVSFVAGWFDDTLKDFDPPDHEVLVVLLDADLYSSTITVLTALEPHIRPGTYVYFDQFNHPEHELRAFDEFLDQTNRAFTLVARTADARSWLFRCEA